MSPNAQLITSLDGAILTIEAFQGNPEDFRLYLSDDLIDEAGVHLAIITDRILARSWEPAGIERRAGYHVCSYRKLD